MNLFPNFAAQRRPQFPHRVFQPPSIVNQLYRPPELLGAIAPSDPFNSLNPIYWNPAMGPANFFIEPWQMPGGPQYSGPYAATPTVAAKPTVAVKPSTTIKASPTPATPTVAVTPSTPVSSTTPTTPTTSFIDTITAWLTAEMITGVPNYWLAAGAAGALLLFGKKGKR